MNDTRSSTSPPAVRAPRQGPLVVVGDALLDRDVEGHATRLSPDAPVPVIEDPQDHARPGGAGLAALLAAADGHEVVLVTALADDAAGRRLRALLEQAVTVLDLGFAGRTPEKIRIRSGGQSLLRLDRGGPAGPVGAPGDAVARLLSAAGAVLVADYGRGVAGGAVREILARRAARVPIVWDPHPRGRAPVQGVRVATPNAAEVEHFSATDGGHGAAPVGESPLARTGRQAAELVRQWHVGALAATLGRRGALLSFGPGAPLVVPAPAVGAVDTCGAGDRFASAVTGLLLQGALPSEAVAGAVEAAAAFVAAGGAAAVGREPTGADGPVGGVRGRSAQEVVATTRAAGGTVVATGGCFDLLHAGHVAVLRAARGLGDALVVCLNSDDSVRRLKGPERPLVSQWDRARVLAELSCVDAVVVFDEDTPQRLLAELRPDVWAKGGDYTGADLPETETLAQWGGQAVLLPYLDGRSTSRLVTRIAALHQPS